MNTEELRCRFAEILKDDNKTQKALLVSHDYSMTGAPIALLEMAEQMEQMGIKTITISAEGGPVKKELEKRGLSAAAIPQLYEKQVVSSIADMFDFLVINTLECYPIINEINGKAIPALWWIHEAEETYINYSESLPEVLQSNISVYTAGPRAEKTLHKYRPWFESKELLYAVKYMCTVAGDDGNDSPADDRITTFALVGTLSRRKGQDVLLEAIRRLSDDERGRCRFLIVGAENEETIAAEVRSEAAKEDSNIEYIRHIGRKEMPGFYGSIDCLICSSRDDPMPVTVTEACLTGCIVICSENTGSAPLLEEYDAGIIYHNDDPSELAECIKLVCSELPNMDTMRSNARKLYDEKFSTEIFAANLRTVIDDITCKPLPDQKEQTELDETARAYLDAVLELKEAKQALKSCEEEINGLRSDLAYYKNSYREIEDAFFWKISKPARFVLDLAKGEKKRNPSSVLLRKGLHNIKENGVLDTARRAKAKIIGMSAYREWMKTPLFSGAELDEQRAHRFSKGVLFSITVPLYNTPEPFLREMIDSVLSQTYSGWELCLADGSDSQHAYVESLCREYSSKDSRIRYRKLEHNLGISENTNACLDMASGDYIALFDHDDVLHSAALHEMMRVICESDADIVYTDEAVFISPDISNIDCIHFKPDFAPDNLIANNYICHFTAFRRSLLEKTGKFRSDYDGSQDHDMMLRLTEQADRIEHIPEVLYFWRSHPQSVASGVGAKGYAAEAGKKAVMSALKRRGISAAVRSTRAHPCIFRVSYELRERPLISIVITSCDHIDKLKTCIDSILNRSTYINYEIIIADNNSKEAGTFDYYRSVTELNENIRIVKWKGRSNYSAINNYAIQEAANGKYILLLNNDTEVITPEWIEEMLMFAQRHDVGAVGAKMYCSDGTIREAGVILGKGGIAGHAYKGAKRPDIGYMGRLTYAQNMTAVTSACMMIRRDVWNEVAGMDEEYAAAFSDVDLCMKIRKAGYLIVWTPYAELYHYESVDRGTKDMPEKKAHANSEIELFRSKWGEELAKGDPYYNPNLTLAGPDFSLRYTRQITVKK